MIGCPLSSDRFNPGPEVVLWRWVVLVLGQVLACLAYWSAGPVGGGADVGDGCEQGVLPEVVGLPPGDLFEQVRVGSAAQRYRYEDRVLELCVLPAAECAFGQEPLTDPLQRQRVSAAGVAPVKRIGGAGAGTLRRGRCCRADARLGRAHAGGQGRFPGPSTFEVGLFGWMAIMQLVLFRASHLATDAAAFLVLDQGAGSRRRQQGRTGHDRPHRTRQCVRRAARQLHGFLVDSVIRDAAALAYDDQPS